MLEALIIEFGLDHQANWREAVEDGRERWRRLQLKAAVRDAPLDAAETLRKLGWRIEPPNELVEADGRRLRQF